MLGRRVRRPNPPSFGSPSEPANSFAPVETDVVFEEPDVVLEQDDSLPQMRQSPAFSVDEPYISVVFTQSLGWAIGKSLTQHPNPAVTALGFRCGQVANDIRSDPAALNYLKPRDRPQPFFLLPMWNNYVLMMVRLSLTGIVGSQLITSENKAAAKLGYELMAEYDAINDALYEDDTPTQEHDNGKNEDSRSEFSAGQ